MRWLSIDPGTKRTGWALWYDSRLVDFGVVACTDLRTTGWFLRSQIMADRVAMKITKDLALVISEFPTEMGGQSGRVALASGSVRKLAAYVGMIEGRVRDVGCRFEVVEPMTWKGQVPKEIIKKRVLRDYPQVPDDLIMDAYDAIGIGRWRCREVRKRHG